MLPMHTNSTLFLARLLMMSSGQPQPNGRVARSRCLPEAPSSQSRKSHTRATGIHPPVTTLSVTAPRDFLPWNSGLTRPTLGYQPVANLTLTNAIARNNHGLVGNKQPSPGKAGSFRDGAAALDAPACARRLGPFLHHLARRLDGREGRLLCEHTSPSSGRPHGAHTPASTGPPDRGKPTRRASRRRLPRCLRAALAPLPVEHPGGHQSGPEAYPVVAETGRAPTRPS